MGPTRQKWTMAHRHLMLAVAAWIMIHTAGCAVTPKTLSIKDNPTRLMENTILRTDTVTALSRDALFAELAETRITYVGERHTNPSHHAIQLEVIDALVGIAPELVIGMEMFDRSYQPVLDQWSAGEIDEAAFLQRTHWYANWGFDFGLYRDILEYAKEKGIRIVALNIPNCISRKISVGGIASLSEDDRRYLPATIDTTDSDHRAYVADIFKMHNIRGRDNFEFFYEAQCTWEDAMAASVVENLGSGNMVVLVGNGHIIRKFGVPNRAHKRNGASFRTIYLAPVGGEAELAWADYLWVTPETPIPHQEMMNAKMKKK